MKFQRKLLLHKVRWNWKRGFIFQEFLSEQCDVDLFCVDDISNHFLLSFDRIMEDEYSPMATDILTARIPTTGEKDFKIGFSNLLTK